MCLNTCMHVYTYEEPIPNQIYMLCFNFSAGIGRTGTFIGLDYLVEEAIATNKVDVFQCVRKMRDNRINMVQTPVGFDSLRKAF